jgi:AbrB family looped-hinge helix DNA binding protein
MTQAVSVTSKGQVTIPIGIREFLGIVPGSQVVFERIDDKVIVKPKVDFFSLKGSVTTIGLVSDAQADEAVSEYIAEEYHK